MGFLHVQLVVAFPGRGPFASMLGVHDGMYADGDSQAFRKLNAVTVPTLVKVPKNDEEDMKMKAEREQE